MKVKMENRVFIGSMAIIFFAAAVLAKPAAKFDRNLVEKTANKAAQYVLSKPLAERYASACAYFGVLRLAEATNNPILLEKVKANYSAFPATAEKMEELLDKSAFADKSRYPNTNGKIRGGHVDWNVFGILPFELYLQTKDQQYLKFAAALADDEWAHPRGDGLTSYTRFWTDDMFMVGALQVQAYRCSNRKYISTEVLHNCWLMPRLFKGNTAYSSTRWKFPCFGAGPTAGPLWL